MPTNHIVQVTDHKNLQSVNYYSSLRERQMENISKILSSSSSTTNAVLPAVQKSLQSHFTEAHSSTSTAENTLQTMFQGNYITSWHRLKIQSQFQNWGQKRKKLSNV